MLTELCQVHDIPLKSFEWDPPPSPTLISNPHWVLLPRIFSTGVGRQTGGENQQLFQMLIMLTGKQQFSFFSTVFSNLHMKISGED